ncbi:glycosyltransferase [Roseovarius spongiae]|nr:glycosyltransferase [Roseovarius spongiae]
MGPDRVHILMGVRDGAAHLPDQLASIARQRGVAWRLTCSDDGSRDVSRAIIKRFAEVRREHVTLLHGPRAGFAANYLRLIASLPCDPGAVALSDQDDIWMPGKLDRALGRLSQVRGGRPALYAARRWAWDGADHLRRGSDRRVRDAGFRNALIENIAPGNTIVLNAAAARLVRDMAARAGPVFAHDWWLYLLISGAGGAILADPARVLLYRQHGANAIGARCGLGAQIARKRAVLRGAFRERMDGNIRAMRNCAASLTEENRALLERFAAARQACGAVRLARLHAIAPYRQARRGSAAFWGAAALGRV